MKATFEPGRVRECYFVFTVNVRCYRSCIWIYNLIECAFDLVVDGSAAHNDGSLTVYNSSSLGAQTTTVISLWRQLKCKGA